MSAIWGGDVVGHRGAAGLAPENTLASFEAAIAAGADCIELDVRRTSDGHAVVFHDLTVDRFVPGARGRSVSRHSLDEMRRIDVGAALGAPGCFVPSLEETLECIGNRVRLNVEVKGSGADGLLALDPAGRALKDRGLGDALLSSFHEPVLRRARESFPDQPRAFIVDERSGGDVVARAAGAGCAALHPSLSLATVQLVARCRDARLAVRAWTANAPEEMRRLMALGVDGIVTDRPDVLITVSGRSPRCAPR